MAGPVSYDTQVFSKYTRVVFLDGIEYLRNNLDFVSRSYARSKPESSPGPVLADGSRGPTNWFNIASRVDQPMHLGFYSQVGTPFEFQIETPGIIDAQVSRPSGHPRCPDSVVNDAVTRCLLNLKNQRVNLGVALAEAKQTAEFFTSTVNRARKVLESAYRRNPREWLRGVREAGSKRWKKVPNYYLENCYALRPLMSDIEGSIAALADANERGVIPSLTCNGRAGSEEQIIQYDSGTCAVYRTDYDVKLKAEVGVVCTVNGWVMKSITELGLTNPFSVAYEKVPYSFVLDWFLPVGDWINTWDASNYLTFESGYVTRITDSSGVPILEPTDNANLWEISTVEPGIATFYRMEREVLYSFPRAEFPSLRNPLSLDKVAKALALLTNVVRGHQKLAGLRI